MKIIAPLYFLLAITVPGQQPQSTGAATTKGSCSPAVTGSGNTIKIKTCGMSKEQTAEFRGMFRQVLEKQVDPKVLLAVLDDIKSGLIRVENGVLQIEQKIADRHLTRDQKELLVTRLSPLSKPTVILLIKNGGAEVDGFMRDFQEVFDTLKWPIEGGLSHDVAPSEARGLGVAVKSQREHPLAVDVFVVSLRNMGFQVEYGPDEHLAADQVRFVVASK
jgi:hypothetical protein